jgi:hypothetical protein
MRPRILKYLPLTPISSIRLLGELWRLSRVTWRLTHSASALFTQSRRGSGKRLATQERAKYFENMNVALYKRTLAVRGMYNAGWTPYEISCALKIPESTVLLLVA